MARPAKKKPDDGRRRIADNRKARRNYELIEKFEAGLSLLGTEVKSLRENSSTIKESYIDARDGELWLVNCHIPEYSHGNLANHEPRRPRRLLMHRREIDRLTAAVQKEGMTIVPVSLYFNKRGRVKAEIALAKGKKLYDRRADEKKRAWKRQKERLMKSRA